MGVIELDRLEVRLGGRTILNGLTGELRGHAIGLLGPNGAGKSTLINTLLGFHEPAAGSARVLGLDARNDRMRIRQSVGYMAELAGLPSSEALERAHEALFYVGLGEVRYRLINSYSLGMKQLVKLAQGLAHGPKLLILDEPTNGLDPTARQRMIQLIKGIRKEGSMRMLISSHLLRDIDETCDEVIILKKGSIAAISNIEEERRSHRNFFELEMEGSTEAFAQQLQAMGCECACFAGGRVKLVMPDILSARDLYVKAAETGVQIRKIQHRRDSLEDIFLRAMDYEGGRVDHVSLPA
jgi:ABC-2 type transport system ATP-binding protein